jgi:hypothetical protein
MKRWPGAGWGAGAVGLWILTCIRWFDAGAVWRPRWLSAIPPAWLGLLTLVFVMAWLRPWEGREAGPGRGGLLLVVALSILFRLPLVSQGAAGAVTPDGALSGIVSLHVRDGIDHLVFVPHVPYSGSLKSHFTAPVAALMDPARAFALVSVLFFAGCVAAVYRLGLLVRPGDSTTAVAAGLYLAFGPPFLTRYSVSNDGNYVEVLALGTWALLLATRWAGEEDGRASRALRAGLLLGLAFWCHILALIHLVAVCLVLVAFGRRRSLPSLLALAAGFVLGYLPGLLWNAGSGWESFLYLLPGGPPVGGEGQAAPLAVRLAGMVSDQAPVLMGYDPGHAPLVDAASLGLAWLGVGLALLATGAAARTAFRRGSRPLVALLVLLGVNLLLALFALPHVSGNPRYLLFLMAPLSLFLAEALARGTKRWALVLLVAFGALGSVAQAQGTIDADSKWRAFVEGLEREEVRWCYTDFYLATKINFLSQERITCSAKLGPTTTEYFFEYRERVERAPEAAFVAVNTTAAERMGRRLAELGVNYERHDLMKPVFVRLSRKVEPRELFPGRSFEPR